MIPSDQQRTANPFATMATVSASPWIWREDDGPSTQRLRRTLLVPFGCVLVPLAMLISLSDPPAAPGDWMSAPPVAAVLASALATVAVSCLLGRFGWWQLVALTLVPPFSLSLDDPSRSELPLPAVFALVLALIGMSITMRARPLTALATSSMATMALLATRRLPSEAWEWVDMTMIDAGVLVAASTFMSTLVTTSRDADRIGAAADRLETQTRMDQARSTSLHRARGLAHNVAVYALDAIRLGQPRSACVDVSKRATRFVSGSAAPVTALTAAHLARSIRDQSPVRVRLLQEQVALHACILPRDVYVALQEASGEALRNVRKHAGVCDADVVVRVGTGSVEVLVRDAGKGLPSGAAAGFGIDDVIVGSMQAIGGEAVVRPRARGTEVHLSWRRPVETTPAAPADGAAPGTAREPGEDRRLFGRVGLPLLLMQSYLALRYSVGRPDQWVLIPLVLVCAVTTILTARRLADRPLRPGGIVASALWALAVTGAGFAVTGVSAARTYESWFVGFAATPLILVAFTLSWRWTLVLVLPTGALTFGLVAWSPSVGVGETAGCWLTSVGVALSWLVGVQIRRSRRAVGAERRRLVDARVAAGRAEADRDAEELHLGFARAEVLPFLAAVAAGDVDPHDESARARATVLVAHARDELALPGLFDPTMRRRVAGFRNRGGNVVVQAPGSPPDDTDMRLMVRLIDRAIAVADPTARLTVTLDAGEGWARLSLAPPPVDCSSLTPELDGVAYRSTRYPGLLQIWYQRAPARGMVTTRTGC